VSEISKFMTLLEGTVCANSVPSSSYDKSWQVREMRQKDGEG